MTLREALDKATIYNLSTAKDKKEIIDKLMSTRSTLVPKVKLVNIITVLLNDITKLEKQIEEMNIGTKENGIWHKVTDWKDQYQFPQEETFPFVVQTRKDGYYLCEWEITEGYGQFYSMYEGEEIDPEDVVEWARIPLKEE